MTNQRRANTNSRKESDFWRARTPGSWTGDELGLVGGVGREIQHSQSDGPR